MRFVAAAGIWIACLLGSSPARQAPPPATVDFVRDVQPILQANCVECHGGEKAMNGFRLDRQRDALRGGTGRVIAPGSAAASRLYLRLVGTNYGRKMPIDTDPLTPAQIETIRTWIDQGAHWPDAAAADPVLPALDPVAVSAAAALRAGERGAFLNALRGHPHLATLRGPGGATPLMVATLYGDAALVNTLLAGGAKPDVPNDAGVTPLMWAVTDLEKTRLLLDAGADVSACSACTGRVREKPPSQRPRAAWRPVSVRMAAGLSFRRSDPTPTPQGKRS